MAKTTTTSMVYGELGRHPIEIDLKSRALGYWATLLTGSEYKLSFVLYRLLYNLDLHGIFTSGWISFVKNTLNECGFGNLWLSQNIPSKAWFLKAVKLRLTDQSTQTWSSQVFQQTKCVNFRMFKEMLSLERYLLELPHKYRKTFCLFRCRNHKLPVESSIYNPVIESNKCTLCNNFDTGDEFHYIFKCDYFLNERKQYLRKCYWKNPSCIKYYNLMNSSGRKELLDLCKFIHIIMDKFK